MIRFYTIAEMLLIFFYASCPVLLHAQPFQKQFEIRSDDDSYLFTGQDKYYTGGTFLTYSYLTRDEKNKKTIDSWELGQMIFTPYAGNVPNAQDQDRPFAGYAFIQRSRTYISANGNVLKLSVALGILGPPAMAQQTQAFVHRLLRLFAPSGWEYQIKAEPGFQLAGDYSLPLMRNNKETIDICLNNHASLSNIFCNAATGLFLRAGNFRQFINSGFFSGGNLSNQSILQSEFFFFSKMMANYILHDASIQGGLFDKKSEIIFKQKPFVLSDELGCQYCHRRWGLSYSVTFKTKEVISSASADQYGTIRLSYKFN